MKAVTSPHVLISGAGGGAAADGEMLLFTTHNTELGWESYKYQWFWFLFFFFVFTYLYLNVSTYILLFGKYKRIQIIYYLFIYYGMNAVQKLLILIY